MLRTPPPLQKHLKHLLLFVICILIAAIVGTILLWAAYKLPVWAMEKNMDSSAYLILGEGAYPHMASWFTSGLDNWTDSLMLCIASFRSEDRNLYQAMSIPVPTLGIGETPFDLLKGYYAESLPYQGHWEYSRYWHGYLVFLKPLLLLTDLGSIRIFNAIFQTILWCFILYLLDKRGLRHIIVPYLVSILFLAPTILARSLQFSSCYYMMSLGILLLLLVPRQYEKYAPYIFLFIGIGTAYLDLLTYPAITLGMPAVIYYCRRGPMEVRTATKEGIQICFSWCFGYIGMWASKWIISSIILKKNILQNAFYAIAVRTSTDAAQSNVLLLNITDACAKNLRLFLHTPALYLAISICFVYFVLILRSRNKKTQLHFSAQIVFPYIVLAILPFAWYAVASNHSLIHAFFTNKSLAVSVFSLTSVIACKYASFNQHPAEL